MSQSISFRKVQSVAKDIRTKGQPLSDLVLKTMGIISDIVGSTLGPGGCPVLIERQETGMPNMVTKDGVTVYRSLGFRNSAMQAIMETARDSSIRTASEAGDGTTTTAVLSEALLRHTQVFLKANPRFSPQKVLATINELFDARVEPALKTLSADFAMTPEVQLAVLLCSTNGDQELADAVRRCFAITGDAGNVTILERGGPRAYEVEQLKGYTVGIGFEESCRAFAPAFMNDRENNGVRLEKPSYILHFGPINNIEKIIPLLSQVEDAMRDDPVNAPKNFVLCATAFSDTLISQLAANFNQKDTIKVYTLLLPKSPFHNAEMALLQDIASLTGGHIFDDVTRPIESAKLADLGARLDYFEANRYRSNIIGQADEALTLMRIDELEAQLKNPESEFERTILKERIAKLTGGIAKLTVVGPSSAEIRERKDRAEDAVCALRGAIRFGALPGSTAGLLTALAAMNFCAPEQQEVIQKILVPAFCEPFRRIAANSGYNVDEAEAALQLYRANLFEAPNTVWDARANEFVDATQAGIVDSLPAVLEAIRNAISVAGLLATCGGIVVFPRDEVVEREEAGEAMAYMRNTTENL